MPADRAKRALQGEWAWSVLETARKPAGPGRRQHDRARLSFWEFTLRAK